MNAVNRDLDLSERDFFSSVNNAFSSFFNPIFPGQTTSQTSTSATITLTQSATATDTATDTDTATQSATSTATVTAPSTSSTFVSTESSSASSSSTSTSLSATPTSSAGPSSTSAPVNDPSPTTVVTSVSTGPQGAVTLTSTSSAASSSTSVTAAANAAASKGFLANKGLSVGVITACSLVGLVLIIIAATWTIRRRRRSKLHDEAIDFTPFPSSDELLGRRNDVERGGGGGTNRTRPSSRGSVNSIEEILPSVSSAVPPKTTPEMYQTGYPAFVPTTGPAPPPKAAITSTTNQIAFPTQAYANAVANYNDYGPYPSYANGYQPAAGTLAPGPGPAYNTAYGAAPAPAPANALVRKASQRKQVPPLNLSATRADANPPAYQAAPMTDNTATPTLANPYGTTPNPAVDPPLSAVSPRANRGSASLLNSPVRLAYSDEGSEGEGKTRNRTSSHSRALDPNLLHPPRAGPLPDQFGAQSDVAVRDEKAAIRQLTVRNE